MTDIIAIKNISKSYAIVHSAEHYISLRDILTNILKSPLGFIIGKVKAVTGYNKPETFWALKNVNIAIARGEIVGVIGPNGAGKSTLLKILNKITEPTTGEVIINGKISSLLEVGTGFHPELTGRENIFFSGAILGMKRREIIQKFNDIVKFAEMEQFIDTPVKRYSSGMQVRLAFSVAVHMEPDIMLIDEVLAVGDVRFQRKCLAKIHEVAKKDKRTILFVSHNLNAVQGLCDRAIYLDHGEIKMIGSTNEVINEYLSKQDGANHQAMIEFPHVVGKKFQLRKVVVKNADHLPTNQLETGQPFSVVVDYENHEDRAIFWTTLQCVNEYGAIVFVSRDTDKNPFLLPGRKKGDFTSIFSFPNNEKQSLNVGRYNIIVHIDQDQTMEATISIMIHNTTKKFNLYPGTILIGEPWQNNET